MTEAETGDGPDRQMHILGETLRAEIGSDQPDLNLWQLAILLVVYLTDEPQTVRGLAAHLNVNKPSVTRALDRLEELDLAHREVDVSDRRSITVGRTARGAAMLDRLGMAMAEAAYRLGQA